MHSWIGEDRYRVYRTGFLYDIQLPYARPTRNSGIIPPMINQRCLHVYLLYFEYFELGN